MKKYYKSLLKLLFVVVILGVVAIGSFICTFGKRPAYSDLEKRELTKKPAITFKGLVTGSYFTKLQEYYNDTIPGREDINVTGNRFSSLKGVSYGDIIIVDPGEKNKPTEVPAHVTDEPPEERSFVPIWGTATPSAEPSTTPDSTVPADHTDGPDVTPVVTATPSPTAPPTKVPTPSPTPDAGNNQPEDMHEFGNGSLIYNYNGHHMGMELYGGLRSNIDKYVAAVSRIKSRYPSVNVYSMTVPISSAYYLPSKLKNNADYQLSDIRYIEGSFADKGVVAVDAYSALLPHKEEHIFLYTDHHWSHLGCYYAMQEFAKVAGVPFLDISKYTKVDREGYLGTYYSAYGMKQLGGYPETFSYYKTPVNVKCEYRDQKTGEVEAWLKDGLYFEYLSMSESYSVCSYFTEHISITTADNRTGRNLLIIRDSYGSPCASFLAGSFDNVIMVDPRFASVDIYSIIEHYNVTDVLSLANVFMHSDSGFCKKISSYLY